jgi:hypothetical protein
MENGAVTVDRAGDADTATVWAMRDLPDGGVLIQATKAWFLGRVKKGAVDVDRAGGADTGIVWAMDDFAGWRNAYWGHWIVPGTRGEPGGHYRTGWSRRRQPREQHGRLPRRGAD